MDKLWAMEVFVRVVECGSFSRAAESLDLANATVTSCIRNLEKHLGVTLIQRNTRHLHLTDEGELFFPKCQTVLASVAQAETEVKASHTEVSGVLRVESPFAIAQSLICPALPAFVQAHPGLSVAMTMVNEPRSLIERATDVAIRMDRVEDADLVARPIYAARYVVCCSPGLAEEIQADSPHQLDPGRCLGLLSEGAHTPTHWIFRKGNEEAIVRPDGPLNFNNSGALIQSAVRGAGVIYVLDIFAADNLADGSLVELFPGWETATRTFHAVTVKSRYAAPKVRAFVDFLLEILDARRRPGINTLVEVGQDRRKPRSR